MRFILLSSFLFLSCLSYGQQNSGYIAVINGDSIPVIVGEEFEYRTPKGERLKIEFVRPDFRFYEGRICRFQYAGDLPVSNTVIEEGITQSAMIKSSGNGYLVQEYVGMDPSFLTAMMLNEITKESVNYGYEKVDYPYESELKGGGILQGTRSVMTYLDDRQEYIVATYGQKDQGIVVVTFMINEDYRSEDQPHLDRFLNTLEIVSE